MGPKQILWHAKRLVGCEELRLYVDVSPCNLKCVMCPRGGLGGLKNDAKGLMPFELFQRIVDKFQAERVDIRAFEVGNWGEPLLNPDLPRMIRHLRSRGQPKFCFGRGKVSINTNLTCLRDPEELLSCGVDRIRVSLSGMSQGVYGRNHRGGNVEKVLENLARLGETRRRLRLEGVHLHLGFHDYVYNRADQDLARKFCEQHGIQFGLTTTYISTVEECAAFNADPEPNMARYLEYLHLQRDASLGRKLARPEDCRLRRETITVSLDGGVYPCCGVYDEKYLIGDLFSLRIRDIPRIDCGICRICARTPISWR